MPNQWNFGNFSGMWLAPACFGCALIAFGVLILVVPWLLQFIVAAVLISAGCSLLALAWHLRGRVTYRRIDDPGPGPDDL